MSLPTTSCCVAVLNQQQETNTNSQCHHEADSPTIRPNPTKSKYCTIVENGRVVVKPIASN